MRQGQRAGLIDTKAEFPQVERDPPEAPALPASAADPDFGPAAPSPVSEVTRVLGLPIVTPAEAAAAARAREERMGR
jgi:hypothetical protein